MGTAFVLVVSTVVFYHHTYFIPIFLGLLTALKSLLKSVTPKLLVLLAKNSIILKLRQLFLRGSTQLLVLSHKPWRLKLRNLRVSAISVAGRLVNRYLRCALWLRTTIALILLILTASSSYVFIALLIIPEPLLRWVRNLILNTLNKLGVTHLLNTLWKFVVPAQLQEKWALYRKWTLGRQQVRATRRMHERIADVPTGFLTKPRERNDEVEKHTRAASRK